MGIFLAVWDNPIAKKISIILAKIHCLFTYCLPIKTKCKMLTIRAMVKKDGLRADQTYNVKVCFTYKRKVKRLSTSLFASADDLTKSLSFKEGTPIKRKIDKLVENYKDKCDILQVDSNDYTLDEIIDLLKADEERQKPVDFIQFCQWWIDTTPIKGKKNYQSALNSFK